MARKIGELFFELRTSATALQSDLKEGERQLSKFTDFIKANPIAAVTGLGAAFAGVAFQAAQAAGKIDLVFRQVVNTLGATSRETAQLRDDMRAISLESGRSREELAGLFRAIAENGPNGASNVKAIADAALALSDALGVDVGSAAAGLDQITDIFQIDPSRAREVAAVLNEIASGRVPLNDVFDALSKIGPEAQTLGLSFQTVASFLTRFLDQGYSVKRVASDFKDFAANGAEGRAEIERLAGAATDTSGAMAKLDAAVAAVNGSTAKQYEILKNQLNEQWLDFGQRTMPSVGAAFALLNGLLEGNKKNLTDVEILWNAVEKARRKYLVMSETTGPAIVSSSFTTIGQANPLAGSSSELGKRFADIVTATKNLERLSISVLRDNQRKLADIIGAPGAGDTLVTNAKELQAKIGEAIKSAAERSEKEAQKAFDKLRDAVAGATDDIIRLLDRQQQETERTQTDATAEITAEAAARERNNTQLAEQVTALLQGKAAYEAVLVAQTRANAEEAVRQRYIKAGIPILKEQQQAIIDAGNAAVEASKLGNLKDGLLGALGAKPETVQEIKKTTEAVGQLAEGLSLAAGAAAGIASAFGEAGRRMATLLGGTSQLLTSLNRAQRAGIFDTGKKDAKGNAIIENVGFLGALSGKAGASGAATAAASALSFVGAAVQIADAIDLFGKRARERARILREQAIAFNKALEEFAITSRTDLENALRANIASANDVAQKGGFAGNFKSVADINAQAEALRAQAKRLEEIGGFSSLGAPKLRKFADELAALAQTATENEAKIRAANDAAIARLQEDLSVRRLALSAGSEAAEQQRAELELQRQENDIRQRYGAAADGYLADLRAITEQELALAAATRRRAAAAQQVEDDNSVLGGSAQERLQRRVNAFGTTFFSGLFDGFDLGSREGLEQAKAKAREFYQTLAADGISEAERPIVDWLKSIIGDIDTAISSLPETLDPIATALEAFGERVQLFGTSLPQQLNELRTIFGGRFGDWFDAVLAGVDLGNADSVASFKQILQEQIDAILSDGVVTEAEQPILEAFKRFLGIANQAIDDATAEATAARTRRRSNASTRISLFDLTGVEAFAATLDGFGDAFAGLFAEFDLTTLAGLDAAKGVLQGIFAEIQGMSDDEIFQRFGLTREELTAALLDADTGLDGLSGSLKDVAQSAIDAANAAADFSDQLNEDYLRSQGRGQEADLAGAASKRDERLKRAAQLGLGPDAVAQIEAIYRADVAEITAKYAAKVAEAVTSTVAAGGGLSLASIASAAEAAKPRTRNTSLVQDFGGLSDVTAQSLAGIQREAVLYAAETARNTAGIYAVLAGGLPAPPLGLLRFAGGSVPAGTTTGAGGIVIGSITVTIGALAADGLPPDQAARSTVDQILRELGVRARRETKFLGDGRL